MDPMMTTTPSPPSKAKVSRLSKRDVDILESISRCRYVTLSALEWMHVPSWWTRWERYAAQHGPHGFYPSSHLYARLRFFIAEGWVFRIKRASQYGAEEFNPEPDLFGILEEGAHILAGFRRQPLESFFYDRKRPRSLFTINHTADIATFYAALQARVQRREGLQLLDWQSEHLTARSYDRLAVRRTGVNGNMETVHLAVQPDATFVLKHAGGTERFFVEIDRGTRPLPTWVQKIQAYNAYMGSPELKARYGVDRFILLSTAPDDTIRTKIMQATASVLRKPSARYLFLNQADVLPTTIASAWHKLATMTPTGNPIRPMITTEPHILIH
jgi:hypothetical protein